MLIKVKKELYEDKEILRYQTIRLQKPNWKEENKEVLKKIEGYISKIFDTN